MAEPIRVTLGGTVVPKWGNGDRADDDKIRVHYKFLSFEKQQELINPADIGKSFAYEARILATMIHKIDNLSVEVDGKTYEITDGESLVASPLDKLSMELWVTFRNLTAVDKKK